jgi:hypothetical protein
MFAVALCLMLVLFFCAAMWEAAPMEYRIALLICAAVTGWVYMVCASRVIRARSPLVIRDESAEAAEHPPDCEEK